jgi:hypothetical protein
MKIYIAAHDQKLARDARDKFAASGYATTSRWLDVAFGRTEEYSEAERADIAQMDADDVLSAEALVLLSGPDRYAGGKFVEAGIAIGAGIPVYVIGRRENMLLWHPKVRGYETVEAMINGQRPPLAEDMGQPVNW